MDEGSRTPDPLLKSEKFAGYLYSILTWIAVALLIIGLAFFLKNFFSYIIHWDISNKDFIQLCIYTIIGTFLLIFVYDDHCRRRFGCKK